MLYHEIFFTSEKKKPDRPHAMRKHYASDENDSLTKQKSCKFSKRKIGKDSIGNDSCYDNDDVYFGESDHGGDDSPLDIHRTVELAIALNHQASPNTVISASIEAQHELGNNSAPGLDLLIRPNQVEALQQENQRLTALVARTVADLVTERVAAARWEWQFDEEVKANRELTAQLARSRAATNAFRAGAVELITHLTEVNALRDDDSVAHHKAMSDKDLEMAALRDALAKNQVAVQNQANDIRRLAAALWEAGESQPETDCDSECGCHDHPDEPETSEPKHAC